MFVLRSRGKLCLVIHQWIWINFQTDLQNKENFALVKSHSLGFESRYFFSNGSRNHYNRMFSDWSRWPGLPRVTLCCTPLDFLTPLIIICTLIRPVCLESVFTSSRADRREIIEGLNTSTALNLFARLSKRFSWLWQQLHANNYLESSMPDGWTTPKGVRLFLRRACNSSPTSLIFLIYTEPRKQTEPRQIQKLILL